MKGTSLFSQLLNHIPNTIFSRAVAERKAEKHAKGFSCWSQLVAMLYCHLARASSLREITLGLSSCCGKLSHLSLNEAPARSTLSYANQHRPAEMYEDLFLQTMEHFRVNHMLSSPGRKHGFRFKNKLLSLDSTTISLCLSLFPWADFRRAKGGVKVHVMLDHADYMPAYALITEARSHDRRAAPHFRVTPGSIIVMDRAYNDYGLFSGWTEQGVWFVTRMKDNALYEVVQEREVPQNRNILADQIIRLTGLKAEDKCPHLLRRVVVWDEERQREIVLLTNHMAFGATTISAIYKDRWQIEVFFKTLKQHLKVKTFVGTTENALRIQIWTAMLALLLIKFLHFLSQAGWSLSNLAYLLYVSLFTYRDLKEWLDDPCGTPPFEPYECVQLSLPGFGQPARA